MKAIGASVTALNLEFFIADILEEQRNLVSTTSKIIYVHKANRTPRDPTCQSKSFKRIESSRLSNRRRRPNKGSSYNTFFKNDDDKAFKNVEIEPESNPNLELESFTCVIRNFDLDDSKSSCFISSLNFKNSIEDFETEGGYLVAFNKSKKLLKRLPNKPDLLLYDINIINYIVNNKKWFKDDYIFNRS